MARTSAQPSFGNDAEREQRLIALVLKSPIVSLVFMIRTTFCQHGKHLLRPSRVLVERSPKSPGNG